MARAGGDVAAAPAGLRGAAGRGERWRAQLEVGDETLAAALARHLERVGCEPVVHGRREVLVDLAGAQTARDALVELVLYLGMWPAAAPTIRSVSVAVDPGRAA